MKGLTATRGSSFQAPDVQAPLREHAVRDIHGLLGDLAFNMYASATGEERDARGRTGAWKGTRATPKQPIWVAPEVVAPPVTTKKGARLLQRAPEAWAEARRGFGFAFEGPSKGEKLPVPAPGKNGCTYRVLGHPFLAVLPDGTLLGVGTECASGQDIISTGKLDGIGWPYQTLVPRLGHGRLIVESWRDGVSTAALLPGGEPVADYPGVDKSATGTLLRMRLRAAIPGDRAQIPIDHRDRATTRTTLTKVQTLARITRA